LTSVQERGDDPVGFPVMATAATNPRRPAADKFEDRRRELATAALQTLSELGYARTSLREIAQNSPYSHGVVHYYFADKVELITYCVRQYKAECVQRYDRIVEGSSSADVLAADFAEALVTTLVDDAPMHRLWYDLRSQALFEASFRDDVLEIDATLERMIWQVVSRFAELRGVGVAMPPSRCYAMFDGLFQHALLRHLSGVESAAGDLREGALQYLELAVV
jgi:AcrR family transcriptional regulator